MSGGSGDVSSTAWNSTHACEWSILSTKLRFFALNASGSARRGLASYLRRRITHALHDGNSEELFMFYRCHRATLRARLAVAHLLEPNPRTPAKWEPLARTYLRLAAADAVKLERKSSEDQEVG